MKILKSSFPVVLKNLGTPLKDAKIQDGVMDEKSYLWGNYLLGNYLLGNFQNTLSYEITFGNASFEVLSDNFICLTGADCDFAINGVKHKLWQALKVSRGDILEIFYPKNGVRNYLNFANNFKNNFKFMPQKFIPNYNKNLTLRILINQYDGAFSKSDIEYFLNKKWQISKLNDRRVYRLEKSKIKPLKTNLYSQGNSFGIVQITNDGEPIIMHKDAPTIGGYCKIGTVFSLDMATLSQKTTGDYLQFEEINIENLQQERLIFDEFFKK
jgi:allophanate hydrolase subunit 2